MKSSQIYRLNPYKHRRVTKTKTTNYQRLNDERLKDETNDDLEAFCPSISVFELLSSTCFISVLNPYYMFSACKKLNIHILKPVQSLKEFITDNSKIVILVGLLFHCFSVSCLSSTC